MMKVKKKYLIGLGVLALAIVLILVFDRALTPFAHQFKSKDEIEAYLYQTLTVSETSISQVESTMDNIEGRCLPFEEVASNRLDCSVLYSKVYSLTRCNYNTDFTFEDSRLVKIDVLGLGCSAP